MDSRHRRWFGFPAILTVIFLIAVLVQASRHIVWRDELRTWQIASECTGPISLIHAMRFDSVPILWNLIVFLLTRISSNAIWMQIVHAFIAAGVVYVVARWAPFSRLSKVLFAFGYFPFFEYAVIARSYSLIFLFMMIACALIAQPRVRIVLLSCILLLLSQVSLWGAAFAGLFFLVGITKAYLTERDPRLSMRSATIGVCIVCAGILLSIIQLFPGPGRSFTESETYAAGANRLVIAIATIYRGLAPIPPWNPYFWNNNILDPQYGIQCVLGLLLFGFAVVLLIRRPLALALFATGTLGLVIFTATFFRGDVRHHGQIFMLLIASFWIADISPAWKTLLPSTDRLRGLQLTILLGLNVVPGIGVAIAGLFLPFSATLATARFIQSNFGGTPLLAAHPDYGAAPITYWLGRPIYYPTIGQYGTFHTQDDAVRTKLEIYGVLLHLHGWSQKNGNKEVILILNSELPKVVAVQLSDEQFITLDRLAPGNQISLALASPPDGRLTKLDMRFIASFTDSIVADEAQWLYVLTYKE